MSPPTRLERTGIDSGRRAVLLAGATGLVATVGCLNLVSDETGPQERSYTVTIAMDDGELTGRVAEATDVEDVVRVNVEDSVVLTFANETDETVGVHDHATDDEAVVDPGGEETMEFEVTEAMVGRQEIEAWVADDETARAGDGREHGADATTIVVVEVRPGGS